MEADWEFELGGDCPLIDAAWPGFVDLRRYPERVHQIAEARQVAGLESALVRLNSAQSPVWTSKCDVWSVADFDPDELDALPGLAAAGAAMYLDLLPRNGRGWGAPENAEKACRGLCGRLEAISLRGCRVDLVIRNARVAADSYTLGVTAYLVACGPSRDSAKVQLSSVVEALVESVLAEWAEGGDAFTVK